MITLTTGQPGAGKTLYTIYFVQRLAEKENRPVYYSGIADLRLPWLELDKPEDWHKVPAGAIVVIDECQRVFRPRGNGAQVPEHVEKLETHRHGGIDLFLITQHPMLADTNVRRLVGRHFHVQRAFGMQRATVHEFPDLRQEPDKNRNGSVRHDFSYPKEVYSWYKSAEVHTVKRRIPARLFFLLGLPLIFAVLVYLLAHWWSGKMHRPEAGQGGPGPSGQEQTVSKQPAGPTIMTTEQYFKMQTPRITGLYHTAPMFDQVMQPKSAPQPKMCIASTKKCICYTDQATRLDMDDYMCRQFSENGYYDVTKPRQDEQPFSQRNQQAQAVIPDSPPRI